MKPMRGNLYIRKLIIVDDCDQVIYKIEDIPVKRGLRDALSIIEKKDGRKTVINIIKGFFQYLDSDFKTMFNMEDEK